MHASAGDEQRRYDCPVEVTLSVIGGKWKPLILWELRSGFRRFSELEAAIPAISHKVLTQHLRELERDAVISRHVVGGANNRSARHVDYALSEFGRTLRPVLNSMAKWAKEHHGHLGIILDWPSPPKRRV